MNSRPGPNVNFQAAFKADMIDMAEWERRISGGWRGLLRTLILYDAPTRWQKEIPVDNICFELDKPIYRIYEERLKR